MSPGPDQVTKRSPLASNSVAAHVARGGAGLLAAVLAVVLLGPVGPVSLLLFLPAFALWRGCPTCWAVGLGATVADGRARTCARRRALRRNGAI